MNPSADEIVEQMIARFDEINASTQNFRKELDADRVHREEIERKLNRLRLGTAAPTDGPDPEVEFKRAIASWYPGRADQAQVADHSEYQKAFGKYMRQGIDALSPDERKAMSVGVDSEGGWLAPSEFSRSIIKVEHANSVIRGIARTLPAGAGDVEFPASLTHPAVGWVGETGARTATTAPGIGKTTFNTRELYAMPEATQKLIDDSVFDIEAFLAEEIGLAFAQEEDAQFIAGDGVNVPRGFTTYPTATTTDAAGTRAFGTIQYIPSGASGAFASSNPADVLFDTVHALRPAYRQNAAWVMGTDVISAVRKLKEATTNAYMWQPGLAAGQPDRLLGYPVVEAEQMPALGANSYSVAFADWNRAYWILDRLGVRVLRDPYTNKPFVRYYATKRVAGGLADSCAIKLIKFSAS